MPIEIRELIIRTTISDQQPKNILAEKKTLAQFRQDILNECMNMIKNTRNDKNQR